MPSQVDRPAAPAGLSDVQAHDRRFWAAVIDVWLLSWVLGVGAAALVTSGVDTTAFGMLAALGVLAAAEARTGRTPGKALTGLRTERAGGGPVGWRRAIRRRSWMALPAIGLVAGFPVGGDILLLVVLAALVLSMGRAPDGRGWHDRLADTEVVPTDDPRPPRRVIALGIVAALAIAAAGWWFHTPRGGSSSFHSLPEAEHVSCAVTHDGWLYLHHERTVTLEPGAEPSTGRFGPHDVTLAFIDDTDGATIQRGLRIDVADRSLAGTTGRSTGTDDAIVDATTGPGIGELIIDCQPGG